MTIKSGTENDACESLGEEKARRVTYTDQRSDGTDAVMMVSGTN